MARTGARCSEATTSTPPLGPRLSASMSVDQTDNACWIGSGLISDHLPRANDTCCGGVVSAKPLVL
eukprot:9278187-Heterocapsa_arctica.AAC.1